ncbi:hypothetical protein [Thermofilum sp.]|uniref:hypothetical protein n=1 Tax=Thermofilum sp. TaxID=1961369 RepID=UPI00315FDBFB
MKNHYFKRRHRSALTVVEITVTSSLVVILGILLLYIASNWYFGSAIETAEEVDKNIQIIRSALMIERIEYYYVYTPNRASLTVRNVAKDNIGLRILAVDLITMDNRIIGHKSLSDQNYVLWQGDKVVLENVPVCAGDQCHKGDLLKYRVWYIPERPLNGGSSRFERAVFVESSFIYAGGELPPACPISDDYVILDIVDPVLLTNGTFSGSNLIYIRPAIKNGTSSKIDIEVRIESLDGAVLGYGGAKNVQVPSSEEVKISGSFSGIKVPFKMIIESPNSRIIQREWVMGGKPGSAFVSGITLLWRETGYMVHTVVIEVGAPILQKDVTIKVSAKILDCEGNKFAEVETVERIPSNMDVNLPVFIKLPEPVRFDQIYSVEAMIVEIG